jgi:hypothetical protein
MSIPRSLAFLLPLAGLASASSAANIWHVTVSGSFGGSGASLSTPTSLDGALAASAPGDEIRIAEGVYTPTVNAIPGSTDPRERSFLINKSLTIIGGWVGHEVGNTPPQGSPANTELNGNLDDQGQACDNSYHVVSITGAPGMKVELSRVRIREGHAVEYTAPCSGVPVLGIMNVHNRGAGIYIKTRSTVTLSEIILETNVCHGLGGGLFASGSSLSMSQSILVGNHTSDDPVGGGAGMYLACPATKLANVVFLQNGNLTGLGGGLYASAGDLELSNCVFDGNKTNQSGRYRVSCG